MNGCTQCLILFIISIDKCNIKASESLIVHTIRCHGTSIKCIEYQRKSSTHYHVHDEPI